MRSVQGRKLIMKNRPFFSTLTPQRMRRFVWLHLWVCVFLTILRIIWGSLIWWVRGKGSLFRILRITSPKKLRVGVRESYLKGGKKFSLNQYYRQFPPMLCPAFYCLGCFALIWRKFLLVIGGVIVQGRNECTSVNSIICAR